MQRTVKTNTIDYYKDISSKNLVETVISEAKKHAFEWDKERSNPYPSIHPRPSRSVSDKLER